VRRRSRRPGTAENHAPTYGRSFDTLHVDAAGEFTHTDRCGEVFGTLLPPDFCGGAVKMSVTLTPNGTSLQLPGILSCDR
jgi:hypothetical protein